MKIISLFLILLLNFNLLLAQKINFLYQEITFEPGVSLFVFGNNTKLRQSPATDSEVIELLKIGESIEILANTENTFLFNGFESPWYKIKHGDNIGYVVGGLLANTAIMADGQQFLFNFKRAENQDYLLTRAIQPNHEYVELITELSHLNISVEAMGDKGLSDIKNVIYLNYWSESCGMEGGGHYLFYDGKNLHDAMHLKHIGDGGIYYIIEELIFPDDTTGIDDRLIYTMESEKVIDEDTNWKIGKSMSREIEWKDGKIYPEDFRKNP